MAEVLGFNLSHSGGLASLPYLARMTFGFIFGSIGDMIRRKEWMTVTGIRKWFIVCCKYLNNNCSFLYVPIYEEPDEQYFIK